MRDIRFRAYDMISGKMYYDGNLENGDVMVLNIDGGIQFSSDDTYKAEDFILMQYTGLFDKNGKGIYEGDVVARTAPWSFKPQLGKIEFSKEFPSFVFIPIHKREIDKASSGPYYTIPFNIQDELEVIGNVYNNQELMDKECV